MAANTLSTTGLRHFIDLLLSPSAGWIVLEVRTDGIFNHVDRDLGILHLEREIDQRLACALWEIEKIHRGFRHLLALNP